MRAWVIAAAALTACGGSRSQLKKADAYLEEGRSGAAVRAYERVLERDPGHPPALVGIARAWIADGAPERAIVPAQVAVEVGAAGSRATLGAALVHSGRGAEAVQGLTLAIAEPKGDSVESRLLLAQAQLAAGDLAAATSTAEEAQMSGGGAVAQGLAAWLHARSGGCERATALAARAQTSAMARADVQGEAAAVFRHCGDAERAQAAASTARTLQADGPAPWQAIAARRSKGGDNEGAARHLSRLRAVWPEEGLVARDLGGVWDSLGVLPRAESELRQALELAPFAVARGDGSVRVVNNQSDALDVEARAAAIRDMNLRLARLRSELGDLPGAAAVLQAVATADVNDVGQWVAAAKAWAHAGQARQGLEAVVEAVNRAPRDPAVQAIAATLYARSGDIGRAIGHGRMAWELQPENADIALSLSALYVERNESREARRVLQETGRRTPGDPRLQAAIDALDAADLP